MPVLPPDPFPVENEILDFFADRNFERSRRFGSGAYDPRHLKKFLADLDNPQFRYRTIHVAGTVGKGSATTYLARALVEMGFRTGAYLSPHFVSLTERFTLQGKPIAGEKLAALWHELKGHAGIETLSFFDAMTALAFLYFAREGCDWAVIETGLGGRLDSTNNLRASYAVITRIDLDHQNILGDTLEKIAAEKAGIIHPGQVVYSARQHDDVAKVLRQAAAEAQVPLHTIETRGDFQRQNREFALAVVDSAFQPQRETRERIEAALREPIFGRLTLLREAPRVFFDGGHNIAAMRALAAFVNAQPEPGCNIFINTMKERDLGDFVRTLREIPGKSLAFYFLPVADPQYYREPPAGCDMKTPGDDDIRGIMATPGQLNLFTGSMGIYKELKSRFP